MFFGSFDFCSWGPREPLVVTKRGADIWWGQSRDVDGLHVFYSRDGGVGAVTIDDPHDTMAVKSAAKFLRAPHWWFRRKVAEFAD